MSEISITKEEALMRIDTLRMAYICDPQECGKKDGYDKDNFLCRGCDETYEALAIATESLEKDINPEHMKWIPHDEIVHEFHSYGYGYAQCPVCKEITWMAVTKSNYMKYCPNCGQRLERCE